MCKLLDGLWGQWDSHITLERLSLTILFFFLNFLAVLRGMQDLSSQPKIKPEPLAVEAGSLNHWTAREVPDHAS